MECLNHQKTFFHGRSFDNNQPAKRRKIEINSGAIGPVEKPGVLNSSGSTQRETPTLAPAQFISEQGSIITIEEETYVETEMTGPSVTT
jgi:hypothetical protein